MVSCPVNIFINVKIFIKIEDFNIIEDYMGEQWAYCVKCVIYYTLCVSFCVFVYLCVHSLFNACLHSIINKYVCEYMCLDMCVYVFIGDHIYSCVYSCVMCDTLCVLLHSRIFCAAMNTEFIWMSLYVFFFNVYAFHLCVSIYGTMSPNVINIMWIQSVWLRALSRCVMLSSQCVVFIYICMMHSLIYVS